MNRTRLPHISVAKGTKWVPCIKNAPCDYFYNASESWGAFTYQK